MALGLGSKDILGVRDMETRGGWGCRAEEMAQVKLGLADRCASKNGEYHKGRVRKHECVGTRHRKVRDMVKL